MYQELIDQMFLARREEREPDGRLHPSSLSGCERQAVYVARGEPTSNEKDIRNIRIMGSGTSIHTIMQDLLVQAYPGTLVEVSVDHGPIKGSADALLPVADGIGETLLVPGSRFDLLQPVYELQEFKSISPMAKRYKGGLPKPEHVYQAQVYYWGLERQGYLMDGIRIIYIDRDDWSATEIGVEPWNDAEVAAFEETITSLENHIEEGTLPPPMPDDYWLCRFCDYRTTCKGIK